MAETLTLSETPSRTSMIDGFGRQIRYARLSVTDRCDLRCRYCMAERMEFRPNADLLSFGEVADLADLLIARGVSKIRLTGGEPLIRKDIERLVAELGSRLGRGLEELTLTSNGTQLPRYAESLRRSGVRRVNVSLDSLDPDRFRHITRRGDLAAVLQGIDAAERAGLRIKINMVALKSLNEQEIAPMLRWCGDRGFDLTLIETMPLGEVEQDRTEYYLPLDMVKTSLEREFALTSSSHRTGGPARYWDVGGLGVRLGLITPLTRNFCGGCNRIRVTATGQVFGCLGHDQKVELRDPLRRGDVEAVHRALDRLLAGKPERHRFDIGAARPAVARHMSATGG